MRALALSSIVLLALAAQDARGQNYFPLGDTYGWFYESSIGSWDIGEYGNAVVNGATVRKRKNIYVENPPFAIQYWTYWSKDVSGNVYLHGSEMIGAGTGSYYDPPVLYLVADPSVGAEFSTTFDEYDLRTDELIATGVTWRFVVAAAEQVDVSLGSFSTFRVDWSVPALANGPASGVSTQRSAGEEILASYWYAADHGMVRYQAGQGEGFDLVEFGFILPARQSTWGELKAHYDR